MKLSVVGHACLVAEVDSRRLVVDPWLTGSVYWGAWSHCPEPVFDESIFAADYVFITHWHDDHFHKDSLARFRNDCRVFVPRFPVSSIGEQMRELGFANVTEMVHARTYSLGPRFAITSFQIQYLDDSVLVIEADGRVIVDLNDAKPLPPSWRAIQRRFPTPDLMLRSHSPAWAFPACYTFDDPVDAAMVTRESYKAAFREAARILRPHYAVPFASGVCHLHREARSENQHLVSARELAAYMEVHPVPGTELVLMPHGASWTPEAGFDVSGTPPGRELLDQIEELAVKHRDELERLYAVEDRTEVSFDAFAAYFRRFLGALGPVRRLLSSVWVFRVRQKGGLEHWSVDFAKGRIERSAAEPQLRTSLIDSHPAVLADALASGMLSSVEISKRWRVHLRSGAVVGHLLVWVLLSLFEAGYLTPRNLLHQRFLVGYARRFPEVVHYALLFTRVMRGGVRKAAETVTEAASA